MKHLKKILVIGAMMASVAQADCCVTNCCTVTKCIQKTVKLVPYKVCQKVCVPVKDACGNIVGYNYVSKYVTKYKKVVVKKEVCCCCCN